MPVSFSSSRNVVFETNPLFWPVEMEMDFLAGGKHFLLFSLLSENMEENAFH